MHSKWFSPRWGKNWKGLWVRGAVWAVPGCLGLAPGLARLGSAQLSPAPHRAAWLGLARPGPARLGSARPGPAWLGQARLIEFLPLAPVAVGTGPFGKEIAISLRNRAGSPRWGKKGMVEGGVRVGLSGPSGAVSARPGSVRLGSARPGSTN